MQLNIQLYTSTILPERERIHQNPSNRKLEKGGRGHTAGMDVAE